MTDPENYDERWAEQVANFLHNAGKKRAECVVQSDGVISFKQWVLNALKERDKARGATP